MKATLLMLLAYFLGVGGGVAHAATLFVSPISQETVIGSVVQVEVTIDGVNDGLTPALGAFDINLNFDPSLLRFQSATFGSQLDIFGLGDEQSVSTPTSGVVRAYEISLETSEDLTAFQATGFTLASFYFYAIGGGTSPLAISSNSLSDAFGSDLAADIVSGGVTVAPVPLPAAGWLLGWALLGYVGLARKRS